jgi:hypothetical protein
MPNTIEGTPGNKERAIFVLRSLIELIENDRVRVGEISNLTADEIIDLAEAEASKAVEGSEALKDS